MEGDEELAEIETIEEVCKRLVRSRRDPEFTPLQYLKELLSRVKDIE